MKTLVGTIVLLTAMVGFAIGDGAIPVDLASKRILAPHTTLEITDSQREEVEVIGTLTLTTDQWQQLRAISQTCPKRIEMVLPLNYHSCGDDLIGVSYAIQLSESQVAVTHEVLRSGSAKMTLERALGSEKIVVLRMDRRGQFYYDGVLIPFEQLLRLVTTRGADGGEAEDHREIRPQTQTRHLGVVRPMGVGRESAVAKTRLDQIFGAAATAGWSEVDLALNGD
jgi:hypothetical protein